MAKIVFPKNTFLYSEIEKLREKDKDIINPLRIIAQRGGQERMLFRKEDIVISGGSRGGAKSFSLVLEGLKDIYEPAFSGLIIRNQKDDLSQIIKYSERLYGQYGIYNRSSSVREWTFHAGGKLNFSYYSDAYEDFVKRFQGKQYNYIGIDEITHIPYEKFKYLATCNRNGMGLYNRIWGTCNPDPDSWVRKFIDWWIGEDGFPIPERDCKVRYCFMDGDSPDMIYWGDTPDEVYEQCSDIIDPLWNDSYAALGYDKKRMFVKSVTFVRAGIEENVIFMKADPTYLANLAQQGEEQRSRDLGGNWNYKSSGKGLIQIYDMENFFNQPKVPSGTRYVSCDIAFEGGDSLVMWLWDGFHIQDLYTCANNAKTTIANVKAKLLEWGVPECNFTYDLNGLGQTFKGFFPQAKPFNNQESVNGKFRGIYYDLKSQCAYLFARKLIDGEISIEPRLLKLKIPGKKYKRMNLRQVLLKESKIFRGESDFGDGPFRLIRKKTMKNLIGHSPDYMEALLMRLVFDTDMRVRHKPKGLPQFTQAHTGTRISSIRFI